MDKGVAGRVGDDRKVIVERSVIGCAAGHLLSVVIPVQMHRKQELPFGAHAVHPPGAFLRTGQDRYKQAGENGDDGDNNEEFNQGEGATSAGVRLLGSSNTIACLEGM